MQYKSVPLTKQNNSDTLNWGILLMDPNNNFFQIICGEDSQPLEFNTQSEADAYIASTLSAISLEQVLDIYDNYGMAPGLAALFDQVPKANLILALNLLADGPMKTALQVMIDNYDATLLFYTNIEQANQDFAP